MIAKVLDLLDPQERTKLYLFGLLSLFGPAAELAGAAMLIPVFTQAFSQKADNALLAKVILLGLLLLLIGGFEMLRSRTAVGLVADISHSWSTRIYEMYLLEEVVEHNARTADQARAGARYDVAGASGMLTTSVALAVNLLTLAVLFCALIWAARWPGVVSCVLITFMIVFLFRHNRSRTAALGEEKRRLEIKASGIITIAYGAYKELKIDRRKSSLLERYTRASRACAQAQKTYAYVTVFQGAVLGDILEAGLFFLLALALAAGVELNVVLPEAMVFLVLFIRILPVARRIVDGLTAITFGRKCLEEVEGNLERYRQLKRAEAEREALRFKPVTLKTGIRMRGVTFRYPNGKLILEGADMDVAAGESTAVIGPSGEGKTTLLDLLLGLLHPEEGHIWYDDYDLVAGADAEGPCRTALGGVVSYIPQIVYLNNGTVRENVRFMTREDDEARMIDSLQCAQIWEDVQQMPQGLDTMIGENGVSISGGQRQRIALARALYRDFEILIMDEATAALDMETEQAVIDAVRTVKGGKTLLMVTHHRSLAEECQHVYQIENRTLRKVR